MEKCRSLYTSSPMTATTNH